MPIKHTNAPDPSFEELMAHVDDVHPDPNDHSPHIPHKMYTMHLNDLVTGKRYDAAQLVGWRFVFQGDDGHHHVADIGIDEATGEHTFHQINMGRHVNNFIAVYNDIHDHETVVEKDYEINLLRVPACYVMAVWFKGADHDHEFLVPLSPVHEHFEPNRHYSRDEFMDLLEDAAREMTNVAPMPRDAGEEPDLTPQTETTTDSDDLTQLVGLNAEMVSALEEMGITSFAALADTDPHEVMAVLEEMGFRLELEDPALLHEQAQMAAAGDWETLHAFQQELKER